MLVKTPSPQSSFGSCVKRRTRKRHPPVSFLKIKQDMDSALLSLVFFDSCCSCCRLLHSPVLPHGERLLGQLWRESELWAQFWVWLVQRRRLLGLRCTSALTAWQFCLAVITRVLMGSSRAGWLERSLPDDDGLAQPDGRILTLAVEQGQH